MAEWYIILVHCIYFIPGTNMMYEGICLGVLGVCACVGLRFVLFLRAR